MTTGDILTEDVFPAPIYDKAKDKRYQEYYIHQYKNTTDKNITYGSATVKPGDYFPLYKNGSINKNVYPGCIKYGDKWTRTASETRSYKDVIVYRLAESYIMAAEAALMKNDQTLAKYYFNKTWERAGNDKFTGVNHERHYGRTSPRAVFRRRQMVFSETSWNTYRTNQGIRRRSGNPCIHSRT